MTRARDIDRYKTPLPKRRLKRERERERERAEEEETGGRFSHLPLPPPLLSPLQMESYEISSPPHDPPFSAPGSPPPSDDTHLSANDALLADDIRGKIIKQVIFGVLFPMCWLWILDCRTLDSAFGC